MALTVTARQVLEMLVARSGENQEWFSNWDDWSGPLPVPRAFGVCRASTSLTTQLQEAHPAHGVGTDLAHVFRFGLLRGGVFWGWPSSHTTIAFAMAVTVFRLFPKQRWLGYWAISYAFYIGFGVSMTIHWLSDFIAGALIGTVVGVVVGTSFSRNQM